MGLIEKKCIDIKRTILTKEEIEKINVFCKQNDIDWWIEHMNMFIVGVRLDFIYLKPKSDTQISGFATCISNIQIRSMRDNGPDFCNFIIRQLKDAFGI